ncbi:MAG: hypothetical protein Q8O75_02530, partial [bacterium]|nr:hypothetical protein [bacterium]
MGEKTPVPNKEGTMRSLARLNAVLLAIVILIAVSSWFWLRQRMDDLNARVEDAQVQLADRQIQLERAEEELRSLQEL